MDLFSIGHSTTGVEDLVSRLSQHEIEVVADVRSAPYSARAPQFNREALSRALEAAGIRYVFLGSELGGRPSSRMRDSEGRANYDEMATATDFRRGLARLVEGASKYRVAVLCSEGRHDACHRWLLVGRVLVRDHDARIRHIGPDGSVTEEPPEFDVSHLGFSKHPVPAA